MSAEFNSDISTQLVFFFVCVELCNECKYYIVHL